MQNKPPILETFLLIFALFLFVLPFVPVQEKETKTSARALAAQRNSVSTLLHENPGKDNSLQSPAQIARSFGMQSPKTTDLSTQSKTIDQATPVANPSADTWLRFLGSIRDVQNIERLYYKNSNTGNLVKVRLDKTEENGTKLLETSALLSVISIDGIVYTVSGGKK